MKVKEIFNNRLGHKIEKFNYKHVGELEATEAVVSLTDEMRYVDTFDEGVQLLFVRHVSVDDWFTIEMEIGIKRFFRNKDSVKDIDLKQWIETLDASEKTELGANVFAMSSLLVAEMTNISVDNPLILPAIFMEKSEEKE